RAVGGRDSGAREQLTEPLRLLAPDVVELHAVGAPGQHTVGVGAGAAMADEDECCHVHKRSWPACARGGLPLPSAEFRTARGYALGCFEAIVLGIVQGLTEFLPISSSAHVSFIGQLLFEGRDPGAAFTAVTQLGTETAVLVYFWSDIVRIIKKWCLALVGRQE